MSLTPGEARTLPLALSQKLLLAATFPSRSLQKNVSNSPCLLHEIQMSMNVSVLVNMTVTDGSIVSFQGGLFLPKDSRRDRENNCHQIN